jgi:hypothetical protein
LVLVSVVVVWVARVALVALVWVALVWVALVALVALVRVVLVFRKASVSKPLKISL